MTIILTYRLPFPLLLLASLVFSSLFTNVAGGEPLFDLEGSGAGENITGSGDDLTVSGSGSGHDSNHTTGPPIQSCRLPDIGPGGPSLNMSYGDLLLKAKCYSVCFDLMLSVEQYQDDAKEGQLDFHDDDDLLPWKSISQSRLSQNCQIYNQVYECQRGCEYKAISGSSCEDDCMDDCRGDSLYLPQSVCFRQCNQSLCSIGCSSAYASVNGQGDEIQRPPPPPSNSIFSFEKFSSPYLHIPGTYSLSFDMGDSNSFLGNATADVSVTSYILEGTGADGINAYYWIMSFDDIVSIDYSQLCKNLSIRFIPVNRYGVSSSYSQPTTVEVYGITDESDLPDHPPLYSINYTINTDIMTGHAHVHISWTRPNNYIHASGFHVDIKGTNHKHCRPSKSFNVHRDQFSVLWTSKKPVYGISDIPCSYQLKVYSVAYNNRDIRWTPHSVPLKIPMNYSIPSGYNYDVSLYATRNVQVLAASQYFSFNVSITLPRNHLLTENINDFMVYFYHNSITNLVLIPRRIPYIKHQLYYNAYFDLVPPKSSGQFFVEVRTIYSDRVPVTSRYVTGPSLHSFDARGLPPTAPRNVKVSKLTIKSNGKLTIVMDWLKAEELYGTDGYYKIHIGLSERVGPDDTVASDTVFLLDASTVSQRSSRTSTFRSYGHGKWNLTLNDEDFMHKRLPATSNWILYVQVLTKNNADRVSNWTAPVVLTVPSVPFNAAPGTSTSSLVILPTATTTGSASESPSPSQPGIVDSNAGNGPNNDWLIPVSGVVAIVLILVLAIGIASVLLLVACVQTKKLGKKSHSSKSTLMDSGTWSEFDSKAVENGALIGIGTFGPVHKVSVPVGGKGKRGKECQEVAVISLKSSATKRDANDFYDYLELLKIMSNFKNSSLPVLQLVGFNTSENPHYIMTELSTNGDLLTYLVDIRQNMECGGNAVVDIPVSTAPGGLPYRSDRLNPSDVLSFAKQIASAMDALSDIGIVHKDLSCRNMYLDSGLTLKVGFFGIVPPSRGLKRDSVYPLDLPLRWMALESILDNNNFTTASDVWAFGVTIWEIVTLGGFPYKGIPDNSILSYLMNGERLRCPANCSTELYSIIESCWFPDPNSRPTFELLHETILNQLTQGDCQRLVRLNPRDFQPSPSTDSALGSSPFPESTNTSCNDIQDNEHDSILPPPPEFTAAVNLMFRKDSLDPPLAITLEPVGGGRGKRLPLATDLDAPRVCVSGKVYEAIDDDNESNGATEV